MKVYSNEICTSILISKANSWLWYHNPFKVKTRSGAKEYVVENKCKRKFWDNP